MHQWNILKVNKLELWDTYCELKTLKTVQMPGMQSYWCIYVTKFAKLTRLSFWCFIDACTDRLCNNIIVNIQWCLGWVRSKNRLQPAGKNVNSIRFPSVRVWSRPLICHHRFIKCYHLIYMLVNREAMTSILKTIYLGLFFDKTPKAQVLGSCIHACS